MGNDFIFLFKKIQIFALVGASGTGKSYQAKMVARKYRIDFIIDDGLLIRNNKIVAGHSAKEEKTFLAAVKVALFDEKSSRDEVARTLQNEKFRRILLIGTSEKMVRKIAARLQLPPPDKIIQIEDCSSRDEIDTALRTRLVEGKHVIPVPSVEVKKNYPDIFLSAISVLKPVRVKVPVPISPVPVKLEKSLVRPAYFKPLKLIVSEKALSLMTENCTREYNRNINVQKTAVQGGETGYKVGITIDVPFGTDLEKNIMELKRFVTENIEKYTGILIEDVNIVLDKIVEPA